MDLLPSSRQSGRMGWLDRTRAALAFGGEGRKKSGERPPLKDLPRASPAASLEDALVAREAGHIEEGRAILRAIDRGRGLRTVLRAAAALEAEDEDEFAPLARVVAASDPVWRLPLQATSALTATADPIVRDSLLRFARSRGAPSWALAWTDSTVRGRVDLLFADAPLARTVAAREWKVEGAEEDRGAVERYAAFAYGRQAIGRFGALAVARVLARVYELGAPGSVISS
jgi:hypothetical protein